MVTAEPRAALTKFAIRVAGGHTIKSAVPASAAAPLMILDSSAVEAASPFIFQLPATSGRGVAAMLWSFSACGYQTGATGARAGRHKADPSGVARSWGAP